MEKLEMVYEGKAKKVFSTADRDMYIIEYKDDATAFNGKKKGIITGKGIMNNIISAYFFEQLEAAGISTHFIGRLDDRNMLVRKVEIIPLEVLVRNTAAGSISKRLGLPEGTCLPVTVLEFCYKNDELGDPLINEYHIEALGLATAHEVDMIKQMSLNINEILTERLKKAGIRLVDFKLEFGRYNGNVILADEISPDTCRLWDIKTDERLDKDRFRKDLGRVEESYNQVLKRLLGGKQYV
jgi:phosphoribosylaminoimidazole-succinocarboxamide synthase